MNTYTDDRKEKFPPFQMEDNMTNVVEKKL
jgi:hypothetical protein